MYISLEKAIIFLKLEINKLENKEQKVVEKDTYLREKYDLYTPLKGVGIMTFAVIVGETNGFTLFNNQKQLVCYAHYDIIQNQSGQRHGKTRISKKGNTQIRIILHMSSLSAVNNEIPVLKNIKGRVFDRTAIKMKESVAVQRKMLVLMYTLWKKNETFYSIFGISSIQESKPLCSVL